MERFLLLLVLGAAWGQYIDRNRPDEGAEWSDTKLDTISLIRKYRYPAELHRVTTKDGYILTLHRIPFGRVCPREYGKGPLVLQHGIFSASTHWVLPGTKNGLGYILADNCYDVWMPNSRGNSLSLGHLKYTTEDARYWDFSWHEMGLYDQPAVFDYILNWTKAENLTYVAHSQGSTSFFVFNNFHPEYTEKVRAAFLLAPIAYMGNSKSVVLQIVSRLHEHLSTAARVLNINSLFERKSLVSNMTDFFCTMLKPVTPVICENILFLATGYDIQQFNSTFFQLLVRNEFYGASVKQIVHYAQLIESDNFQEYDYRTKNPKVYGQPEPPQYDLKQVRAPIHLYYSSNDLLADRTDVYRLIRELPNVRERYLIPFEKFNHLDHQFAKNVVDLEYDHLVESIDRYYL